MTWDFSILDAHIALGPHSLVLYLALCVYGVYRLCRLADRA